MECVPSSGFPFPRFAVGADAVTAQACRRLTAFQYFYVIKSSPLRRIT